jgi:hypothetical protein
MLDHLIMPFMAEMEVEVFQNPTSILLLGAYAVQL